MLSNIQNYIFTSLVAVFAYYYSDFDFVDYIIFLVVVTVITIFVIAFSNGEKIAYLELKKNETNINKAVGVNVSTFKYLLYSLFFLAIISGFVLMVMYVLGVSVGLSSYSLKNFRFEASGLFINLLPFMLNIIINRNTKGWLTDLKNKYFFVLAVSIFIPFVAPTDFLKVFVISLLFAYTTNTQISNKEI
ncbi:MAG: hypothetical protein WAZ40_03250 [Minisyncoccia bacterium]